MKYTKEEREAHRVVQEGIKNSWKQFDAFMSEQGWEIRHLFMRGNRWTRDEDTIIRDRNGWHLNGAKITTEELMRFLNVNIDDPDAEINIEIARLMTLEAVLPFVNREECL